MHYHIFPTPDQLLKHQIEHYKNLLAQARQTDDVKRRAFLRKQLHALKIQRQQILN